jgi:hypothetical protein
MKDVNLDALFEIISNPDIFFVNYLYCDYLNFSTILLVLIIKKFKFGSVIAVKWGNMKKHIAIGTIL